MRAERARQAEDAKIVAQRQIIEAAVRPLRNIDSIRIMQVDELNAAPPVPLPA